MTTPTHTWTVTWEQLHADARQLAHVLRGRGGWRGIVAISRGGLVPAAIVARELDLRLVDTLCAASYDHRSRGELRILKPMTLAGDGLLVLDDLSDTGQTLAAARVLLPQAHCATLYCKPAGRSAVDTYVAAVDQDTWIHFPWDLAGD